MKNDHIDFDAEKHIYRIDGKIAPNVTSALNLFAVHYARIPKHILEKARDRGVAVHLATEYDDQGKLDYNKLNPELKGYVDAWRKFKKESGFRIHEDKIEVRVYHYRHKYAGTLDRIGSYRRKGSVLDIKTGHALRPTTGPQTAAYEAAYRVMQDDHIQTLERYGVELHKDGSYTLQKFDDPGDLAVFLASLTLLRWQQKNNINGY